MPDPTANATAPRVVLLARAGKAADNLADALRQAGADLVLVVDPAAADEAALRALSPQAVLVALEPSIEPVIERLEALLADPSLTVIFDEAELAAQRAGWDAARWVRHLAAKLRRDGNVLPPGTESDQDWQPSPGQLPNLAAAYADADLAMFTQEAAARAGSVPSDGMQGDHVAFDASALDTALAASLAEAIPTPARAPGIVSTDTDTDAATDEPARTVPGDADSAPGGAPPVEAFTGDDAVLEEIALESVSLEAAPLRDTGGDGVPPDGLSMDGWSSDDTPEVADVDGLAATPAADTQDTGDTGLRVSDADDDADLAAFEMAAFDAASFEVGAFDPVALESLSLAPDAAAPGANANDDAGLASDLIFDDRAALDDGIAFDDALTLAEVDLDGDTDNTIVLDGASLDAVSLDEALLDSAAFDTLTFEPESRETTTFDGLSLAPLSLEDDGTDAPSFDSVALDATASGGLRADTGIDADVSASAGSDIAPMLLDDDAFFLEELSATPSASRGDAGLPDGFDAVRDFDSQLTLAPVDDADAVPGGAPAIPVRELEDVLDFVEDDADADTAPSAPAREFSTGGLSLSPVDDAPAQGAPAPAAAPTHDLSALEARISSLSLVDLDEAKDAGSAMTAFGGADGVVLVEAGLGGPDPARQLLAAIPAEFPAIVLVRLHLQGGRYDRLVAQMERAAALPVALAENGGRASAGTIYFMPDNIGLAPRGGGLGFVTEDAPGAAPFDALTHDDSALVFLSGSDLHLVDAAVAAAAGGMLVIAQAPEDCYDGAACAELRNRGIPTALPADLAVRLATRWPS